MGIFKAYDIRGVYGQELTDDMFYKIARAYARFLGSPKKIVVARDIRPHSEPLFAAFARGLNDMGVSDELLRERHAPSRRQRDDHCLPQHEGVERLQALPRERRPDLRRKRHQGHRADGDGG